MSRQKKFSMWMTDKEYERLKAYAEKEGVSMAEIPQDYIKTLDTTG